MYSIVTCPRFGKFPYEEMKDFERDGRLKFGITLDVGHHKRACDIQGEVRDSASFLT